MWVSGDPHAVWSPRGGSWNNTTANLRASNRNRNEPASRNDNNGVSGAPSRAGPRWVPVARVPPVGGWSYRFHDGGPDTAKPVGLCTPGSDGPPTRGAGRLSVGGGEGVRLVNA